MQEVIVGIDLGTTYSSIAWTNPQTKRPEVLPNLEGEYTTPSVVLVEPTGNMIVGKEAIRLQQMGDNGKRTVRMIKRNMGTNWNCFPNQPYMKTAEEVSAAILQKLAHDAACHLEIPKILSAVITVPAYFDNDPRVATMKAGELAGLQVKQLLDEPVASAFMFGIERLQYGELVLVYDLGGGTFDTSILEKQQRKIKVLRTQGSRQLGGYDWNRELKKIVLQKYEEQMQEEYDGTLLEEVLLEEQIEQAKRMLSELPVTTLTIQSQGQALEIAITRQEFERVIVHLVQ